MLTVNWQPCKIVARLHMCHHKKISSIGLLVYKLFALEVWVNYRHTDTHTDRQRNQLTDEAPAKLGPRKNQEKYFKNNGENPRSNRFQNKKLWPKNCPKCDFWKFFGHNFLF